jgi:hypothetical protein
LRRAIEGVGGVLAVLFVLVQPVCGGRFYSDAEGDELWSAVKAKAREAIRARGPKDSGDPTEDGES